MSEVTKEIQIFNNQEFGEMRVIEINSEPWFVAKDISDFLNYSDASAMTRHLDEDEKATCQIDSLNKSQIIINESGLYSAILRSKRPEAKKFKKWVTSEVLPSIRKTGGYIPHSEEDDEKTILAKALVITQKTIENKDKKIKSLEKETLKLVDVIESQKPKLEYLDKILNCDDALLVTSIAQDYGLTANALNKILSEEKVQRNLRGQWILYADYQGKGYIKSETKMISDKPRVQTLWTQKGRMLIHDILKKREIKALMDLELAKA
jgi:prophage antirepressor-like protein